jgi:peptide/nickel transport system substrate-binding protein
VTNWGADRIEAVAFEDAWRKAKIEDLAIIELAEVASRVQALASGQIDMALDITLDSRPQIEAVGGSVIASPTLNILTLMINSVREGPLQDVRIRQALNYGVDKQAFIDSVLEGMTVAAGQPVSRDETGSNPDVQPYPYDPDKAKALLAEAGFPNGLKLTAEVATTVGEFSDAFQHIAGDLKKVGVDLELKVITTPDLIAKILNRKPWAGDAFSMQYEGYPTADASRPLGTHSCNFFFDSRWTCEKPIMDTINAAGGEFDLGKREKLLQQVMAYYHDNATALYMYERLQVDGMAKNVKNYQLVNRTINWHEIELTN